MSTLRAVPSQPRTLRELVAAEVRAQLARQQISQQELAKAIGLSQASISERLRGKTPFTTDDLERIADALGVHPAALLGGTGGNNPSPTGGNTLRSYHGLTTVRDGNLMLLSGNGDHGDGPGAMRTTRTAAAA